MSNWLTDHVFTSGLWALAGRVEVHAAVDLPLLSQKETNAGDSDDLSKSKFPVLIFSHGMASGRNSYTHLLGELASRGYIVAAIEHRDGSGPGTIVVHADGSSQRLMHTNEHDVVSAENGHRHDIERPRFKHEQIEFRNAEIEEVVKVIRLLDEGQGDQISKQNPRGEGEDLAGWKGRLDLDSMFVGGHSFGAVSALRALRTAPSSALPFKGGIVLDPGKESGPLNTEIDVPIVIINSDSWSSKHSIFFGRPHFDVVRDIAEKVLKHNIPAWFLTSMNTTHPSCTDAPVIAPTMLSWATGSTVDAKEGVMMYIQTSWDFMRFIAEEKMPKHSILAEGVSHRKYDIKKDGIKEDVKSRWKANGWNDMWQVHVAPTGKSRGKDFKRLNA